MSHNIRIRFGKHGVMKYIGHLDIMRYFQKAMRRAEIPMAYSEGYHPHQIMSFAAPLGLGVTSDGEYMDIGITELISSEEAIRRLNEVMVEGMEIHSFRELPEKAKNAMASVTWSNYRITYRNGIAPKSVEEIQEAVKKFYDEADAINIIKKTKKSEREVDLKPLISQFEAIANPCDQADGSVNPLDDECGQVGYLLSCSTGSLDNINPKLVLDTFHAALGVDPEEFPIRIYRYDMYTTIDDKLVSLEDVGTEIK